jgi:methionyl-tRNA synthetase
LERSRFTVTAALPYANGPVHIGHLAGCYIPADIYVRYLRIKKMDVLFICGSDEHGVPITIKAKKEGITPQEVVDKYHAMMGNSFKEFGISFDIYSRTSHPIHHTTAQDFFKTLYDKKAFTEQNTLQYYDEEQNQFLADRYIEGTCPNCGNENAYGDQCEKCGTSLNPTDLINPRSKLSGNKPVLKETKNWFLPLDVLQPEIEKFVSSHTDWKDNVYGQCKSWLGQGLHPRAMTRDLDWGVKVPLPDAEGKVLYVWFDAPIGYISATRELTPNWELYWKKQANEKDNSKLIHFIGKDNIVFHCIIFPAMLMQHGDYILPTNVPANEFLNLEGNKISTSRNWAVWLHEYLLEFPDRQDELRYVLTSIAPETKDSEFTWKDFQARVNNELADILGNYIKRVVDLVHKYCEGKIPSRHEELVVIDKEEDLKNASLLLENTKKIEALIENFKFREAQTLVIEVARNGNQYLQKTEPWKLIKTDRVTVEKILYNSLQTCVRLAELMAPFLPFTSKKLCQMLNLPADILNWDDAWHVVKLKEGHSINLSEILFPKIEDEAIARQLEKLEASKEIPAPNPVPIAKASTSFEDFCKMDIRVGTILEASRVPKTDKLLKLTIDTGIDKRTVVSGIAAFYEPENIIGQQVSILVNLEPRKIKGIESQGMILMAEDANGRLCFVAPTGQMSNGGEVR